MAMMTHDRRTGRLASAGQLPSAWASLFGLSRRFLPPAVRQPRASLGLNSAITVRGQMIADSDAYCVFLLRRAAERFDTRPGERPSSSTGSAWAHAGASPR